MTRCAVEVGRAQESARNRYGSTTHAYFWEFPYLPDASVYEVTVRGLGGRIQQVYRLLQSDIEATAITSIPILTGDDPFPPAILVRKEPAGIVPASFYRRDSGIRYLLVWGGGFDPAPYYNNTPLCVVVIFEEHKT